VKRLITHTGDSYLTGDELANAVCHYSIVLARVGATDVVELPVAVTRGGIGRARLTIGWHSGVVAVTEQDQAGELEDIVTVLDIYSRAAAIRD
jgi:hypothetical protein